MNIQMSLQDTLVMLLAIISILFFKRLVVGCYLEFKVNKRISIKSFRRAVRGISALNIISLMFLYFGTSGFTEYEQNDLKVITSANKKKAVIIAILEPFFMALISMVLVTMLIGNENQIISLVRGFFDFVFIFNIHIFVANFIPVPGTDMFYLLAQKNSSLCASIHKYSEIIFVVTAVFLMEFIAPIKMILLRILGYM